MRERVDFTTLERPGSPNTFLLAPAGLCRNATPDLDSPEFPVPPDELFTNLVRLVDDRRNWTEQFRNEEGYQIDFVATTKVLRFKDDVAVRVMPVQDGKEKSQLAVYSKSRVGYHDMGANRKRVELLIRELKQ